MTNHRMHNIFAAIIAAALLAVFIAGAVHIVKTFYGLVAIRMGSVEMSNAFYKDCPGDISSTLVVSADQKVKEMRLHCSMYVPPYPMPKPPESVGVR